MSEKIDNIKKKVKKQVDIIKQKIAVSKVVKKNPQGKYSPTLQLLNVIVNRGIGENVSAFLKEQGFQSKLCSFGLGTATTNLENIFGLYNKEKDVIQTIIPVNGSDQLLDQIEKLFLSGGNHPGIAFTIPLKSITKNSIKEII